LKDIMPTALETLNKVNVIIVTNPFDVEHSRKIYTYDYVQNTHVDYYFKKALFEYNPVINHDNEVVVGVNGGVIDFKDNWAVFPNDTITICPIIQGGGGGGGNKILRTVASLAILIASIYTAGAVGAIYGATYGALAGAAVGIAGNLLVNALFPTALPSLDGLGSVGDWGETSPTYGWTVSDNPVRESSPLPELYGRTLCVPPIISKHITTDGDKQYLNLLLALSQGPVDSIDEIYINDTLIDNYKEVSYELRGGTENNILIEFFNDTFIDQPVGYKLINEEENIVETDTKDEILTDQYIYFTTEPNTTDATIKMQYPNGIYKIVNVQVPIYDSGSSTNDGGGTNDGFGSSRGSSSSGGTNADGSSSRGGAVGHGTA
jgi:uncharacterized membrane protein YgcG